MKTKKTTKTQYRIEWMWNGNYRYEENNGLVFDTKAAAESQARALRTAGTIPQMTRIVEIQSVIVEAR